MQVCTHEANRCLVVAAPTTGSTADPSLTQSADLTGTRFRALPNMLHQRCTTKRVFVAVPSTVGSTTATNVASVPATSGLSSQQTVDATSMLTILGTVTGTASQTVAQSNVPTGVCLCLCSFSLSLSLFE